MCNRSEIRTLHDLVHSIDPETEGVRESHNLCLRLMALAGIAHEAADNPLDDGTVEQLSQFPCTIDLGKVAVLVGDLEGSGAGGCYKIAVSGEGVPPVAQQVLEQHLRPAEVTWVEGPPLEPYADLYRHYLVREEVLHVKEPLDESAVAIGEHIPLDRIADFGYVDFPCAVQPLIGGTRLQIHKDGDTMRLFAYHGADVTDEARYVPVMSIFGHPGAPQRAIVDCVFHERQKRVLLLECISWDGELTYKLPLGERLERLSVLRRGRQVEVSPHMIVSTPYEFAKLRGNVVIKSPTAPLTWPEHGWIVGKAKHIQPGRVVPYHRITAEPMRQHIASVRRAEGVFTALGLAPGSSTPMVIQKVPSGAEWVQLHCCHGALYAFTETMGNPVALDNAHSECYSPLAEEEHDWVINAFRTPDGEIVATDCLEEDGTSLHAVALSTRLRVLRGKLGVRLEKLQIDHDIVSGVEDLRQAIADRPDTHDLMIRRADTVYSLPDNPIEVDVTIT